jgi:DNA-binding GntR family transcriptional regulator
MRLMQVTNRGVAELMRVRLSLESLAVRDLLATGAGDHLSALKRSAERYRRAAEAGNRDTAVLVSADEAFHGELCRTSGNATLLGVWQSLARQLAVLWGLAAPHKDPEAVADEHDRILAGLEQGDAASAESALAAHIGWLLEFDFEAALEQRRSERARQ